MFMLYAILAGLLAGWLLGGSLANLGALRIRWAPLAVAGLLTQVVLFFGPVAERIGDLGMPVYVGSTALVLAVVLRNLRLPGLVLVAAGALSNMLAIVANGGFMPASAAALAFLGKSVTSRLLEQRRRRVARARAVDRCLRAPAVRAVRERLQHR